MQLNITQIAKKAISASLKLNWEEAVKLNAEILEKDPANIEAKLRLGRAYLFTKDSVKAKKMFKEVLAVDPINQVALKNMELLNSNKINLVKDSNINAKALIKEPGTTTEIEIALEKGVKENVLVPGEVLEIGVKKKSIEVYKPGKKDLLVCIITDPDIVMRVNKAHESHAKCIVSYIKGSEKIITLLLRSEIPVFKSDKQDVRPYLKKGSLDETDGDDDETELIPESD